MKYLELRRVVESRRQTHELPDDPETVNEVLGVAKSFGMWASGTRPA